MCSDFVNKYGDDEYEHPVEGLIYITTCCFGPGAEQTDEPLEGCACSGPVCEASKCSCIGSRDSNFPLEDLNPVLECHEGCCCGEKCQNKVVQRGPLKGLKVLQSETHKGFGVFTSHGIPGGSFVCEYAGEILSIEDARKRFEQIKSWESNYILVLREHFANQLQVTVVDPSSLGNIGRYVNHSCDPNLKVVPVRTRSWVPVPALVAIRNILPGEELCYDYESAAFPKNSKLVIANKLPPASVLLGCQRQSGGEIAPSTNSDSSMREGTVSLPFKKCLCLAKNCRQFLPTNDDLFT